jgi:ankyrin repeat protein
MLSFSLIVFFSLHVPISTAASGKISKVEQLELAYFYAVRQGKIDIVREFIEVGVDINFQNNQGYSALMVAAFRGQIPMVDFLLKRNANTCLVDKRGNTALMAAIVSAELTISRKLMRYPCHDESLEKRAVNFSEYFGQEKDLQLRQHLPRINAQ